MAPKESTSQSTHRRASKFSVLLIIIISLAMVIVFKIGFIFILIALLPSVVAYYIDITPRRTTFHTVFACNLAGIFPFIGDILSGNGASGSAAATMIMGNTTNWLIVYSAAGFGWVLVFAMPLAAQFFINNMHQRQISRLQRMQNRITMEWGSEVDENTRPISNETNA